MSFAFFWVQAILHTLPLMQVAAINSALFIIEPFKNKLVKWIMLGIIEGVSILAGIGLAIIAITGYKRNTVENKKKKEDCCCDEES